ncbi:helix-turn-helix transcriptional regulator [Planosporangium thailandense]|uniref:Helix-turn-helix transcriptional regulator n=1 Tax=Planosporangium thailandense TaxID=765197 RepID=A0ABX0Y0N8_9ACTN|nr:helix-turn-helix domain-containing protein [Planosporangium thailandense]NJC71911.1 helix-turn-helix transcriptional regulator [Planosporangium thailandense]
MAIQAGRSLGEKLNYLFATMKPRGGQKYSNEQVAAAIRKTGVTISQSYVWQLRRGMKDNPTLRHLQALADFFGVPAAYFFDDEVTGRVEEQLERLRIEQARVNETNAGRDVRLMAMRAGELSAERRRQVMDLLDVIYRLEQAERDGSAPT